MTVGWMNWNEHKSAPSNAIFASRVPGPSVIMWFHEIHTCEFAVRLGTRMLALE